MNQPKEFKPTFKPTDKAFEQAIKSGRLSVIPNSPNFAYEFMYMGTWEGKDQFKNSMTRKYLA